jgi:ATP-dependent helicase/nuclease subunit B
VCTAERSARKVRRFARYELASASATIATVNHALLAALDEGATVVTPNRRLARSLHRDFDFVQQRRSAKAWPTPTLLPYPQWLRSLWDEVLGADPASATPIPLTPAQSALHWRQIVDADSDRVPLLDGRGAAALAAEAWSLVHQWGAGGESWRAWRAGDLDDPAVFARWAETYAARLRGADACDLALVPDLLAARAETIARTRGLTAFVGFIEPTPQQARLFAALQAAGTEMQRADTLPEVESQVSRTIAATPHDEIACALAWARDRAAAKPGARIGIVVDDLTARRESVVGLATDMLCPSAALPGGPTRVPFEISLGPALSAVPLVATALDLIVLLEGSLETGRAAALLRSPYLSGAETLWTARASAEREWLRQGTHQVSVSDAIVALDRCSRDLALRWRAARDARAAARPSSPREWSDAWRAWLAAAGWPGTRPLDSDEYQTRVAWERLLLEVASLGTVAPRLSAARALATLQILANEQRFQPEGGAASIQILGVLEASGLAFDALWVAGLAADCWPSAPSPNPLLPLAWQRQRNVARATPQREREYAQALIAQFARAAPEVIFSSAATIDDHPSLPSALILGYPECAAPPRGLTWTAAMAQSATLESVVDDRAPPLERGSRVPGGAHIVVAQSDCPFKAVARHRLSAKPWPLPSAGLTPLERGILVHAALARFWTAVRDSQTLSSLDDESLGRSIGAAVEGALGELPPPRWRGLPSLLRDGEVRRLAALLRAWLAIERTRPAFVVDAVEAQVLLQLGGVEFALKRDRVDVLAGGNAAIVDYKTGPVERPRQWFDERPMSAQIGLYALAQATLVPERSVRAVGYAELRPEGVSVAGLADEDAWPGMDPIAAAPGGTWIGLEAWWRARLEALAEEIRAGQAAVTPRLKPSPCRNCRLQPLCRIESVRAVEPEDANDE